MIENYKDLDSHKLDFHLEELYRWKKGETVYPIHLDVGPAGGCVNRCVHCYLKWYGHVGRLLSRDILDNIIEDGRLLNLKSIFIAGSGEPLLNSYTPDFIVKGKCGGIDMAMATGGYLLKEDTAEKILPYLNWIRFNILAYSKETFAQLHGCSPGHRDVVFHNLEQFALKRAEARCPVGTGIGTCIIPEAVGQLEDLIRFAKDSGVDYISLRPVSVNARNQYRVDNKALYRQLKDKFKEWEEKYTDETFRVLVRRNLFFDTGKKTDYYSTCDGVNFIHQVDADGGIYSCGCFVGDERYCMGNLNQQSYREIITSTHRQEVVRWTRDIPEPQNCDEFCRCHNINKYLHRHKHPPRDINFI